LALCGCQRAARRLRLQHAYIICAGRERLKRRASPPRRSQAVFPRFRLLRC
jgi:hypothetical protein